jgi:leader peptidase (prepilin peptidase) / N-methyltransferase
MGEIQSEDDGPVLGTKAVAWVTALSVGLLAGVLFLLPAVTAALTAYLFFTMALITLADLRHFIIPDVLSLPALPIGLMASAMVQPDGDWLAGLSSGLAGALVGGGAFYLLRAAYFSLRHTEGLGMGDVKLAAVAGAWLGPAALAPACLVATLSAIASVLLLAAFRRQRAVDPQRHVPFGSFIAPTILVFWVGRIMDHVQFW